MDEFDALHWILSGDPVPVEIDGAQFALRQPTPLEMDRLRFVQTKATDRALAEYRADGLADLPVSDELVEARRVYLAVLEAAYQQASENGDAEAARQAAQDMEDAERNWPRTLADERAREYSRRAVARWIVDTLLTGDREQFRKLTAPDPLEHNAVVQAVQRLLAIINHDPNSRKRTQ